MNSILKKGFLCAALGIGLSLGLQAAASDLIPNNVAEARSDYYVGYDPNQGCDMYIDRDTARVLHGSSRYNHVYSANVHWTNGHSAKWGSATLNGEEYYSPTLFYDGSSDGFRRATGVYYRFAMLCSLYANDNDRH